MKANRPPAMARRRCTHFSVFLLVAILVQFARCQPGVGHRFISAHLSGEGLFVEELQAEQHQDDPELSSSGEETSSVTSSDSSSRQETQQQEQQQSNDLFGVFDQLGTSWYAILQTIRNIVRSSGGTTFGDDVFADDMTKALVLFKGMIPHEWKSISSLSSSSTNKTTTLLSDIIPLAEYGKSLDDLYLSFLHWSIADSAEDQREESVSCSLHGGVNAGKNEVINVSKAYRRMERYIEWVQEAYDDLVDPNGNLLSAANLLPIWNAFHMKMTYDDCGRLVWWLDLALIDLPRIQSEISPREITQLFVWIAHYIMFNPQAQNHGIVFFSGMGHIDFWNFMTMLPLDTGLKLDSFTISVIPAKTKFLVLYDRPGWAKFLFQLIKPFLRRSMQRRVIVIEDGLYTRDVVKDVLGTGKHTIPSGLGHFWLEGSDDSDFLGPLFDSKLSHRKRQKILQKQLKAR